MRKLSEVSCQRVGLVLAFVLVLATTATWAREGRGSHQGPFHEKRLEAMAAELDLSEAQRRDVEGIMQSGREQAEPYVEQVRAARKSMRPVIEAQTFDEAAVRSIATQKSAAMVELAVIRARGRHEVRALLTPEQQQRLDAMHEKRMGRHHGPRGAHRDE